MVFSGTAVVAAKIHIQYIQCNRFSIPQWGWKKCASRFTTRCNEEIDMRSVFFIKLMDIDMTHSILVSPA